jgi:hypothetical protein
LAFIGGVPATLKVTERFEALEQRRECAGFQKEFFSEAADCLIVPLEFATGRFLARAFMKYGWDLYAPDEKTRNNP